jgi:multiple sugar transport system substrate-binding protein/sn-glycerol 3-phosphate transport system substrate-binding protein
MPFDPAGEHSPELLPSGKISQDRIMVMRARIYSYLSIITIAALLLGGCVGSRNPTPAEGPADIAQPAEIFTSTSSPSAIPSATETATPASTPTVYDPLAQIDPGGQQIVFWHIYGDEREQALAAIVNDFNASNPYGIQVSAGNQGSYVDIFNKMLEAGGTPEGPDVLIAFQNQAAIYHLNGWLADLNGWVSSPTWGCSPEEIQSFFPGPWNQDLYPSITGLRLGIPFHRSVDMLYYNADWLQALGFNEPPDTPDRFSQVSCAAAGQPFSPEVADQSTGTIFFSDASRLAAWTFALGGEIYDSGSQSFTLNSDQVKGVLTYQRNLIASGCARQAPSWDYDQQQFVQGKVAMILASSSLIAYFSALEGAGQLKFRWGAAAYPHLTPQPVSNSYGPSVSIVKSTPERELAAFLFLKHLVSPESQARWAQASGLLPIRSDLGDALTGWFEQYPAYQTAYRLMANTRFEPALPGYDFVRVEIESAVSAALEGGDVQAITDALNTKAAEIIANQGQ